MLATLTRPSDSESYLSIDASSTSNKYYLKRREEKKPFTRLPIMQFCYRPGAGQDCVALNRELLYSSFSAEFRILMIDKAPRHDVR